MHIYYDITDTQGVTQTVYPMEQARESAAHEAAQAATPQGDSLYKDVRIATQADNHAVLQWVIDAIRIIEVRLRTALLSASYADDACTITLKDRYTVRDTTEMADEIAYAAANYALSRWLEIRLPEKAASYLQRFNDRTERIAQFILRKDVPTLPST